MSVPKVSKDGPEIVISTGGKEVWVEPVAVNPVDQKERERRAILDSQITVIKEESLIHATRSVRRDCPYTEI